MTVFYFKIGVFPRKPRYTVMVAEDSSEMMTPSDSFGVMKVIKTEHTSCTPTVQDLNISLSPRAGFGVIRACHTFESQLEPQ